MVCIPAHSSKRFGEYIVSASAYRECEFNRKPKSREESVREFSKETSPLVIENRLMFIFGDVHIPGERAKPEDYIILLQNVQILFNGLGSQAKQRRKNINICIPKL